MTIRPIIPIRRDDLSPEKDGWTWELKLDGYRGIADTINGRMLSKNLNPLKRFNGLLDALKAETGVCCDEALLPHRPPWFNPTRTSLC